jgi:hypothetical protein
MNEANYEVLLRLMSLLRGLLALLNREANETSCVCDEELKMP